MSEGTTLSLSPEDGVGQPATSTTDQRRSTRPSQLKPILRRLQPRLSTLLVSFLLLRYARPSPSNRLIRRLVHWISWWIVLLNWRIVPIYWHVMTLFYPIAHAKFTRWRLGSTTEAYVKSLGVVGKSPFEARIVSKHCATWNACDFNFHMSNSAYAIALDEARAIWQIKMIGSAMRADHERVRPMIASTHFTYFSEIPILADFEVEFRPVAWDNKWLYFLATFTTDPPNGSKTRTVNCLSITRMVNKIGRRTIPPEKLMSLSGLGQTELQWQQICHLRHQNHLKSSATKTNHQMNFSQEWLLNGQPITTFFQFDPIRRHNLEIIRAALDGDPAIGAERLKELTNSLVYG